MSTEAELRDRIACLEAEIASLRQRLGEADLDYYQSRREHAFMLRLDGLRYKDIGNRLGVSTASARMLALKHAGQLNAGIAKARFRMADGSPIQFSYVVRWNRKQERLNRERREREIAEYEARWEHFRQTGNWPPL